MQYPVFCTPLNPSAPMKLKSKKIPTAGRLINFSAECNICDGQVIGYDFEECYAGRCCLCGQYYNDNLTKSDTKMIKTMLNVLKKACNLDKDVVYPPFLENVNRPVYIQLVDAFGFCRDGHQFLREFHKSLKGTKWQKRGSIRVNTKIRECCLSVVESFPGGVCGFRIMTTKRREDCVYIVRKWDKRIVADRFRHVTPDLDDISGIYSFIKLHPFMPKITDSFSKLYTEFEDDLSGERQDRAVIVGHTV